MKFVPTSSGVVIAYGDPGKSELRKTDSEKLRGSADADAENPIAPAQSMSAALVAKSRLLLPDSPHRASLEVHEEVPGLAAHATGQLDSNTSEKVRSSAPVRGLLPSLRLCLTEIGVGSTGRCNIFCFTWWRRR